MNRIRFGFLAELLELSSISSAYEKLGYFL